MTPSSRDTSWAELHASPRQPSSRALLGSRAMALERDLVQYLEYYNFDRARTGRLTKGHVPGEIVYRARKVRRRVSARRYISGQGTLAFGCDRGVGTRLF